MKQLLGFVYVVTGLALLFYGFATLTHGHPAIGAAVLVAAGFVLVMAWRSLLDPPKEPT